jgi:predicted ATPase/DNA-binding XRE family transcriptional regulator
MPESISFGTWLRQQRRAFDLTQKAFADQVGCAEITVRRMEADEYKPSKELALVLFEKLGIPEPERAQWVRFARGISNLPIQSIPQPNKPNSNLPVSLTSFIGREKEQSEAVSLIDKHRLVTLTGSGGVGKTRFAIKIGEQLLEHYPDGVWLIELTSLNDPSLLPQIAATVFGLRTQAGISYTDLLANFLQAKSALLILDNCEQLLDACAHFAETLLKNCAGLKILVTSREPLEIAGEALYRIPSLRLPDLQYRLDTLRDFESVKLFEERAQLIQFDFSLTLENAASVAQICHRLDGIPLAIELAAARINVLRVEQIAARLDDAFRLLIGGNRTALPRQQTLQATMDWSYDLLSEKECILLRRLSVFAGGWMLEAAEAVCAGDGIESTGVLDLLTQLVNKSLVIAEPVHEKETRYRMLEIIRQYTLTKLMVSSEADATPRRHTKYYLALAEAKPEVYINASIQAWQDRVETEHDNMRTALAWSQSAQGSAELRLRLARALGWFWINHGYWSEGRGWLEGALMQADVEQVDNKQIQAQALEQLGFVCTLLSDYEATDVHFVNSLKLFQELGDVSSSAKVLSSMGWLARERGDTTTARLRLEESLGTFRKFGDKTYIAYALLTLGEALVMQEDVEGAARLLEESLSLYRELGEPNGIGWTLNHQGHVAQIQGEYERATRLHEESLPFFHESAQWGGIPWAHQGLGETALAQGNAVLATTHLAEALALFHEVGDREGASWCLAGLAGVAALDEEPERAAWLWGAAEALRQSIGAREAPAARATHERLKAHVRKQLAEAEFNAKWAEGQAASVEQAINEATL